MFFCVMSKIYLLVSYYDLDIYFKVQYIWVSKIGFGVGVGIDLNEVQKLGWVDVELIKIGKQCDICVFIWYYYVVLQIVKCQNLIVILFSKVVKIFKDDLNIVFCELLFDIFFIVLKMVWSVLFYYDVGYIWLCRLIGEVVVDM